LLESLRPQFGEHPEYRVELAMVHLGIADVARMGDEGEEEAVVSWRSVLDLFDPVAIDPDDLDAREALLAATGRLISLYDRRVRLAEGLRWPECARELRALVWVRERLVAKVPTPENRTELANTRLSLARVLIDRLQLHRDAARALAEATAAPASWPRAYEAAAVLGRCMTAADREPGLTREARKVVLRSYGDQALVLLRRAAERKRRDLQGLATASDFMLLRERPEFRALVAEVEANRGAAR
jgi:hypothetical protein